jgi:aerobic carbon-monoxide dehydrogenase medium subunit
LEDFEREKSIMIAQKFDYIVPASLGDAVNLLQKHGHRAKILAGGHSLIPMMKLRLAAPELLIDIGRIPELSYVKEESGKIRIGALTTHHVIETSELIQRRLPALADAAGLIGDVQVRNKGTIGGSIAHADPAADYPASILALEATIVTLGPKGQRLIPASKFFVDMMTTALEPNEIVREIQFATRSGTTGSAYLKMAQKASGFAICGAAAALQLDPSGAIANVGIGITGVASYAFRTSKTEAALKGQKPSIDVIKAACEKASDGIIALDDIHASADYRLDLARIYARRAIEAAIDRAG